MISWANLCGGRMPRSHGWRGSSLAPVRVFALALLLIAAAQGSAIALQPADHSALGVPQQDNAPLHGGGAYQHPLGGFYYLLSAIPQYPAPVWQVLPQPPPGTRDPMIGQAILQPLGFVAGQGHFAKLKGTQAGWVKVEVYQNGQLVDWAYYALYDIATLEDQKGGTVYPNTQYKGHDPRYGWMGPDFLEEGGYYYFQGLQEPPAESMFGFDDRDEGAATAWTGMPSLLVPPVRIPRWMPQSQLMPSQALQTDSVMTSGRDCQHLRLWLHGPSDASVQVPIHVHCYSIASGEVEPGRPGPYPDPNQYDISYVPWGGGAGAFVPPDLYIQGQPPGGYGQWPWPGGVSHDPSPSEDMAIKRHNFRDPPPFAGAVRIQRNWILTVPLKAKRAQDGSPLLSGGYADIEIEARIPTLANVAKLYGDPNWADEGVMQFRWGTVIGLNKTDVKPAEPAIIDNLKEYWYRRVRYELKNPVCDPDECTLAFAAKVVAGESGRANDPARIEVTSDGSGTPASPPPEPMPPFAEPYFKELNVSTVNTKLTEGAQDDPFPWAHWTVARWPEDARGHWYLTDGSLDKPESVCMKYRGYVGVIQRTPAPVDFDDEVREYEDKPPQGSPPDTDTPITKRVPVHFINVIGDVNNDGLLDYYDEDEDCEEGNDATGMLVNCDINGNTMNLDAADPNARKVKVLLSTPVAGADYTDYRVLIRSDGAMMANLNFWKDDRHQAKWEYDGTLQGWVVTLAPGGADVDIFLGCVLGGPATTLQFFLVHHVGPGAGEDVLEALDEIKVSFTKFGIDVDSDNTGTVNDTDDMVEELKPGLITLLSEPAKSNGYQLKITKHPNLSDVEDPTVTLVKEGAGKIRVLTEGGAEFLAVGDSEKEFADATIDGSGNLLYKILPDTKGEVTLKLRLSSGGRTLAIDWLRVTVVAVDASIRNGLENFSGGQIVAEPDEESVGAITVANLNSSDSDATADVDDAGPVVGEKDLMRFVMTKPDPATDIFSEVRVRIEAGNVRAYNNSEKQTRIDPMTLGINGFNEGGSTQQTWWLEAREASGAVRDIDIRYEGHVVNSDTWVQLDRVRATAIWVEFSQALYAGALPGDCSHDASDAVATFQAADGSLFGFGPCRAVGGANTMKCGRVLFEWTIGPAGVDALPGVAFDVTRQGTLRAQDMTSGSGVWVDDATFTRNLPANDEEPNDDNGHADEDNTPANRHIYSFDGPGDAIAIGNSRSFMNLRFNFREFVRVRLDATAAVPWPFANTNGTVEGSRCSDKHNWHFLDCQRRDNAGNWENDTASPSASRAILTGAGNGTMDAPAVDGAAATEGFTATYASASDQWTMSGTTVGPDAGGATWTIAIAGKVTVVIHRGATAFGDGAHFDFSVFRTARAEGKANEVKDGEIDATDGP